MTELVAVAPGWYQDPKNADSIRWWNGSAWTNQTEPKPGTVAAEPAAAAFAPVVSAPAIASALRVPEYQPAQAAAAAGYAPYRISGPALPTYTRPAKRGDRDREVRKLNPLAWAGIVLALLGLIFSGWAIPSIAAIVLSAIGLGRSVELGRRFGHPIGRGHAIAGLIIGIASIVFFVILVAVQVGIILQSR